MLTYSVRPRGGVVHALSVAGALADARPRGRAVRHRPARHGLLPRAAGAGARRGRTSPPDAPFDERICALIDAYTDGLRAPLRDGGFDVVHAQDCISANAALDAARRGRRRRRRAHRPPRRRLPLAVAHRLPGALDRRARPRARRLDAVDRAAARRVRRRGRARRPTASTPSASARRATPASARAARDAAGLDGELAILTVGGIEPRKGSLTLLRAFAAARAALPERRPVLLVARRRDALRPPRRDRPLPRAARATSTSTARARARPGRPTRELEGLYRAADVFALPSTKEGFGLAVLEALAAGAARGRLGPRRLPRPTWPTATARCMAPGRRPRRARPTRSCARRATPSSPRGCATAGARWRRATAGTPPRRRTRRPTRASWPWRSADGARGRGHAGAAASPPTSRRASTRSASTSPRRPAATDSGMMPTELFCAALASCFCLAVGFAAAQARPGGAGAEGHRHRRARRTASCATSTSSSTTEAELERRGARAAGRARAAAVLGLQHAGEPA